VNHLQLPLADGAEAVEKLSGGDGPLINNGDNFLVVVALNLRQIDAP
jgi:hypothetical protein